MLVIRWFVSPLQDVQGALATYAVVEYSASLLDKVKLLTNPTKPLNCICSLLPQVKQQKLPVQHFVVGWFCAYDHFNRLHSVAAI